MRLASPATMVRLGAGRHRKKAAQDNYACRNNVGSHDPSESNKSNGLASHSKANFRSNSDRRPADCPAARTSSSLADSIRTEVFSLRSAADGLAKLLLQLLQLVVAWAQLFIRQVDQRRGNHVALVVHVV